MCFISRVRSWITECRPRSGKVNGKVANVGGWRILISRDPWLTHFSKLTAHIAEFVDELIQV